MSEPTELTSLARVRDWLQARLRDGARCPACDQYARVYRRPIPHSSVLALARLDHASWADGNFVHLPTLLGHRADEAKLAYWGLIQEEAHGRPDGGRAGYWRVTTLGHDWLRGHATVPKYALIYNAECLGLEGDQVTAEQCVGNKFDLRELMDGYGDY